MMFCLQDDYIIVEKLVYVTCIPSLSLCDYMNDTVHYHVVLYSKFYGQTADQGRKLRFICTIPTPLLYPHTEVSTLFSQYSPKIELI